MTTLVLSPPLSNGQASRKLSNDDVTYTWSSCFVGAIIVGAFDVPWRCGGCLLFTNVTIPKNSTINSASFATTNLGKQGSPKSYIRIVNQDNPAMATDLTSYDALLASCGSTITCDTLIDATTSPDLSSILQPIFNRSGWASGNGLILFWDDHDDRSSHSANGGNNYWYVSDAGGNENVTLTINYT